MRDLLRYRFTVTNNSTEETQIYECSTTNLTFSVDYIKNNHSVNGLRLVERGDSLANENSSLTDLMNLIADYVNNEVNLKVELYSEETEKIYSIIDFVVTSAEFAGALNTNADISAIFEKELELK